MLLEDSGHIEHIILGMKNRPAPNPRLASAKPTFRASEHLPLFSLPKISISRSSIGMRLTLSMGLLITITSLFLFISI